MLALALILLLGLCGVARGYFTPKVQIPGENLHIFTHFNINFFHLLIHSLIYSLDEIALVATGPFGSKLYEIRAEGSTYAYNYPLLLGNSSHSTLSLFIYLLIT